MMTLRRGWKMGAQDFVDWLGDKLSVQRKRLETRREKEREVDEILAERLAQDCLRAVGWSVAELRRSRKGDAVKVEIARQLRTHTPMTRQWIARRLHMGSSGYLSNLLGHDDVKL
jgi:hypothetical protein